VFKSRPYLIFYLFFFHRAYNGFGGHNVYFIFFGFFFYFFSLSHLRTGEVWLVSQCDKVENTPVVYFCFLVDASKEVGLEVNPEKTKYMLVSRCQKAGQRQSIKIGNRSF
jgi:hypothetical protein